MSDGEQRHNVNESHDKIRLETALEMVEDKSKPWQDEGLLAHLYHVHEMSGPELAEVMGCSKQTIYRHLENVRDISEANKIWTRRLPLNISVDKDGYEYFQTKINGEKCQFFHHRLLAASEFGVDAVGGMSVHHKNGVPWDNRPENLEIMSQSNHVREHLEEIPQHEKTAMWALRETECTADDVGEMFGHSRSTVTTVWKRIEDGDYPITEVKA
jgi:biotin operon repressor